MTERKIRFNSGIATLIIAIALFLIVSIWVLGTYNSLANKKKSMETTWQDLEKEYAQRADLLQKSGLLVKGFSDDEETITVTIQHLVSQWNGATSRDKKIQAAGIITRELDSTNPNSIMSKIVLVTLGYPQLQPRLISMEEGLVNTTKKLNRLQSSYNQQVYEYNQEIDVFPSSMIAKWFGFSREESIPPL
jgi:LemA protein